MIHLSPDTHTQRGFSKQDVFPSDVACKAEFTTPFRTFYYRINNSHQSERKKDFKKDFLSLTCMYILYIYMHMRTTLNIDDGLLDKAARLTGITEKTTLVRRGLEALITLESSKRLARLEGSEKFLRGTPRRRIVK